MFGNALYYIKKSAQLKRTDFNDRVFRLKICGAVFKEKVEKKNTADIARYHFRRVALRGALRLQSERGRRQNQNRRYDFPLL